MQKILSKIIQAIMMAVCLSSCVETGDIKVKIPNKSTNNSNITNRPPLLANISNQIVLDGQAITTINANDNGQDVDRDGEVLTYSCFYDSTINGAVASVSACSALSGVSFNSTTGVMNWTPVHAQIGAHEFIIIATDGLLSDQKIFSITVNDSNLPPVLDAIANQHIEEETAIATINAGIGGTDVDANGDTVTYTCYYDNVIDGTVALVTTCSSLSGLSFSGTTGVMNWTPTLGQTDDYEFIIVATDGVYSDDEIFTLTFIINQSPSLSAIADQTVNEGIAIATINAGDNGTDFDIDGDAITYSCVYDNVVDGGVFAGTNCSSLSGATFSTSTGVFNWLPTLTQSGNYEFKITGTDGDYESDAIFTITVVDTNIAPVLDAIADITVGENSAVSVNANDGGDDLDADGEAITYSCYFDSTIDSTVLQVHDCSSLSGTSFNSSTGVLSWTPSYAQSGFYEFIIIGTDGSLSDSEMFSVTVTNTPRGPSLDNIGDQSVVTGNAITTINANDGGNDLDADGLAITYACYYDTTVDSAVASTALCTTLTGVSFSTTTGVMDWTPDNSQAGQYEFKIVGTSSSLTSEQIFAIDASLPPPATFRSVWTTTTNSESITLPLKFNGTYNFEVDWGDGSPTQWITSFNDPDKTHSYAWAGNYLITISGVMTAIHFDGGVSKDNITTVLGLGDIGLTDLSHAFEGCTNLGYFVSGGGTGAVTTMAYMFYGATGLQNVDFTNFDTGSVVDMGYMFYGATSLNYMDLTSFNTSNVTSMYGMFAGTTSLGAVDTTSFDTFKVTNMSDMFANSGVYSLDFSNFNTSNVTNMAGMFSDTPNLMYLTVTSFDTVKVTNMYRMFASTGVLNLNLSSFRTTNLLSAREMFTSSSAINYLNVTGWDISGVTDSTSIFSGTSPSLVVFCNQGGSPGTGSFFGESCSP